jgi:hypothetical protein
LSEKSEALTKVSEKSQRISSKGLWISTGVILALLCVQGLSGNWITFLFNLPGAPTDLGIGFYDAMVKLSMYHIIAGFSTIVISILILIFAFINRSNLYVRIFAVLGFIIIASAIIGGMEYVNSMFKDRWPLGQMADSFIGAFAAYFIQLFFLAKVPRFLRKKRP